MLEEERTKRMNELEKMAKKHKRKQKYPMSIFPDYKKGAEEFNKNSTPLNQDALSSADASSGMAEDIRKNNKKGINEEMDDFLYWEMAEPQCTGYDCDSNIEYVYGDNEDRVWIEVDGKKYKVYVNQWDTKPTATFTSLKKAKAFGEKYWQDNYGYIDESLSEEYIPDLTQRYPEGFNGESAYRTPWDDEYRAWDELSRQQKEEEEEFERLKKTAKYKLIREYGDYDSEEDFFQTKQDALNSVERLCDVVYRYNKNGRRHPLTYLTLENIKTGKSKRVSIEDMLDYYNGTNQTNESLNERFTNGTLADFNPQDLMDKVKSRLEAINTVRTNGNMIYMISIHPHGLFVRLSPETKYDVFIVSEDDGGNQEWVSSYDEFSNLLDTEVVAKLNEWKNSVLNMNESFDNDDHDRPVLDKSNNIVNSLISNLNASGFEVEDYEIKDNDIVVLFYDDISGRNLGFLRRSFSGPTKAISSVTALDEYNDNDDDVYYNNIIFELQQ